MKLNAHAEGQVLRRRPARPASTIPRFNLLGWTPGSFDSWNVIANIIGCRDANGKGGTFNFGGYCNPKIDGADRARSWSRPTPRSATSMIAEAFRINHEEAGRHPAAPAVARLGRVEEGEDRAAGRQPDPVLLGDRCNRSTSTAVARPGMPRRLPTPPRTTAQQYNARLRHPPALRGGLRHADGGAARLRAVPLRRRSGQPDGRAGHLARGPRRSCARSSASTIRSPSSSAALWRTPHGSISASPTR